MITLGIKGRIRLLAMLPVAGIALVLSAYFIHTQLQSLDHALNNHGEALARHLAHATEYAVFSGNRDMLEVLVKQALEEDNVAAVTVTDKLGFTLMHLAASSDEANAGNSRGKGKIRIFSHPINQQTLPALAEDELFYSEEGGTTAEGPLGWVIVELSLHALQVEKNAQILNSVLITLLGIALSLLLATRLGRGLTSSLLKLHHAAKDIQRGRLDVDIRRESEGELGTLEEGFQAMATALQASRKNLQRQIDRATAGLQESIETVEQQNAELREARLQALAASKAKSVFLANMSHELRTPMNGILGFTRLLQKTPLSDRQLDYVETIEKSAGDLLNLLNDILDISRIEAGKLQLQKSCCNLRDTIDDALNLLAPAAQEKGLELVSLFYGDVPETAFTAPERIRQILLNLVGNAIKFSSAGSIVIRTQLEEEDDRHLRIRISVSDQGIGISAENQRKLFNTFEQIDNSMTRKYQGAGLGLAISRSLAELLGGEIGVESREGEGATFWFTIECPKQAEILDDDSEAVGFAGHSVAICDDNESAGLALMHLLRDMGIEVHLHQHPETLFRQIDAGQPLDIVFMDIDLHGQDAEILQTLLDKRTPENGFTLVLLINSVDPITLLHLRQQYDCLCLSKPLRRQELQTTLAAILAAAPVQPGTTTDSSPASSLAGYRILVAEDNAINAQLLDHSLRHAGAQVVHVNDGLQAIDAFHQHDFDTILMDIHMPVLNGIQATQRIRTEENAGRHIPIIGLTASLMDSERQVHAQAGIDAVLQKPVEERQLIGLIKTLCQGQTASPMEDPRALPGSADTEKGSSPALQASLTDMLIRELPEVRRNMQSASEAGDWQGLRRISHKFLGGLAYCDAEGLHVVARRLHRRLVDGEHEGLDGLLRELFEEMDRLAAQGGTPRG